ncbi:lamin tail domain-containing protein [Roseiconus lacunae]|uniref:Lamin tail domain-containing protein n=1 Tax=Roseiconus lacunae TaxID=2605694 RepID=A0ABT7PSB1_9BACT|nr:lamin tail domain-containing protein [Roseiconus lacunae]MDM4019340.1 lamin tail domain-containing protein [Roseiconus lacunae]
MRLTAAMILLLLTSVGAYAEELRIVLWNAQEMFGPDAVADREDDLDDFAAEFGNADILILDEITSLATVDAIRDAMNLETSHTHTACSDFSQDDDNEHSSLEVGLISRFPLSNVIEYDPSPDNTNQPGEPTERQLHRVGTIGGTNTAARGFLTARIAEHGLTILATHLKSSRSSGDDENARKREFVAAAMARFVATTKRDHPNETVLVAGDMNVGERDLSKIGYHLAEDNETPADGNDGYDDTHAIFSHGRVDNLHMVSLTKGIIGETYDSTRFAGSGPIDCMYVVGRQCGGFTLASKSDETFGSDHFAVWCRFFPDPDIDTSMDDDGGTLPMETPDVKIVSCLPNPSGPDPGNERVTIRNDSDESVRITGWTIKDEASNSITLTGELAAGQELNITIPEGDLPLNNGGDELVLINSSGTIVDTASYTSGQAGPGQTVTFD